MIFNGLSDDELNDTILEIVTGKRIVNIKDSGLVPGKSLEKLKDPFIYFRQPTADDLLFSNYIRKRSYVEALSLGLKKEADLDELDFEKYFSSEDQEKLESLRKKEKAYRGLINKGLKGSEGREDKKKKLAEIQKEINDLELSRGQAKIETAEFKSKEDQFYVLLSRCTFDLSHRLIWDNYEEFLNEPASSESFLRALLWNEFVPFYRGFSTATLRYVARSIYWKDRYYAFERSGIRAMDREGPDLSVDQLGLLAWSRFYDSVYEMLPEYKPSEEVITDDAKLDEYLTKVTARMRAEASKNRRNANKRTKLDASDSENVIVTAQNENFVTLHKEGAYSDPSIITGRADDKTGTAFNEGRHRKLIKNKLKKQNDMRKYEGIR